MCAFTPSASWQWQTQTGQLQLQTGQFLHRTPFQLTELNTNPSPDFTLAQAELFWQFWHALEQLQYPAAACFAAAIDALAAQQYLRQTGHKSWWFTAISADYQPACAELVWVGGQQPLLALVTQQQGHCCQLLLLEDGHSLQGKALYAGEVLMLLNDRVQPWLPASGHKLAKSA
ncbi:hypothetical protein [Rheinheimera sp.]|uniref:hypothetical protein n=1 Tax=Rheinheimera sp. TaxID=1869214 RepID=UPI002FDD0B9E